MFFFTSSTLRAIASNSSTLLAARESTTVSLHRPSFPRFRLSEASSPSSAKKRSEKGKGTDDETLFRCYATTSRHAIQLSLVTYTFLLVFFCFSSFLPFVAIIARGGAQRDGGFVSARFTKVKGGGDDDEDYRSRVRFAILNHCLSGWYPLLSSYRMFALFCTMSSLYMPVSCARPVFTINQPRDKRVFTNAKIDTANVSPALP